MSSMQTVTNPVDIDQLMEDTYHFVCHCTDNEVSYCGMVLGDGDVLEPNDETSCPLCMIAFEKGVCPWGCNCGEC